MVVTFKHRGCPICGSKEKTHIYKQEFETITENILLSFYDVVCCKLCGFTFADGIPDQEHFDTYYSNLSKYEMPILNIDDTKFNKFQHIATFIESKINKGAKILEIGCATGMLLSLLKRRGYTELFGIDPSASCIETLSNQYGIDGKVATIASLDVASNSVDCLILVGVLEHICDLNESIQILREILKTTGKLIIIVPDASEYYNGDDAPFQEFSLEHINFFGPGSLTNLMRINNFELSCIDQDIIEVNNKTYTPIILSIYSKEDLANYKPILKDTTTATNLIRYVNNSNQQEKSICRKIDEIVEKQTPLYIWGTGALTLRLLAKTNLKKANIAGFVDSNPKLHGKYINGIEILSPNSMINTQDQILILTRAFQEQIEFQIRNVLQIKSEIIKIF